MNREVKIFDKKKTKVIVLVKVVHSFSNFLPFSIKNIKKTSLPQFCDVCMFAIIVACSQEGFRSWNGDKKSKIKPLIHQLCVQKTTSDISCDFLPFRGTLFMNMKPFSENLLWYVEVNYDTMHRLDQVSKTLRKTEISHVL